MDYAVETYELTKTYRSGGIAVTAVDHVNLNVKKGSIFGLLGPNGAGKTTLIMMLTGLTLPTSGGAKVLGHDIIKESLQIRKKVGIVPEGVGFYEHLTAKQNLNYIAALNDLSKAEREKLVKETLKQVGLEEFEDRNVSAFSRGMKQRLAVAQALMKNPEVLICDEPTAGLDPEGAKALKDLMLMLNKEKGETIILSTHLLFEVGPLCTDLAIIGRGKIILQGGVAETIEKMMAEEGYRIEVEVRDQASRLVAQILSMEGVSHVEARNSRIIEIKAVRDVRSEILSEASKLGVELLSLRRVEPTLEDLFMKFYQYEQEVK
jgi:ABC-2 type transport system ATP-binding protein